MSRLRVIGVALVLALYSMSGSAQAQDAGAVLGEASKALGVDTLNTVEYSATGFDFVFGQAYNPGSPWPKFINKSYTRAIDFRTPASKVDRIRMQGENPPRGGGQQPVIGEQPQNQTIIVNSTTPWVSQLEIWMTPHGFVRAARARNATVKSQMVNGKRFDVVTFTGDNKALVNGYLNEQHLVERVETWIDTAYLGDTLFEATYADYKDIGGALFPMKIGQRQGGYPIFDLTVSEAKANTAVSIQPPQGRGGAPAGGAPPAGGGVAAGVPTEKLADGIYLILGGYASVAVDFRDYIVVIEGPQSEARAQQIIDAAKQLIPGKPIRYVVNTHHHFDHSSGLRTFVAEGATVVTHEVNKAYFEKLFALPHTLGPDRLQQAKRAPRFETMTEKKVLTDGARVIELHHLKGSGHNEGLIVAYLPKEKILVEADAYNPPPQPPTAAPAQISPYSANLAEAIAGLKLDVQRIIPIHYPADNRHVALAELQKMTGRGN
ncbi:MAG TPA: MBL fold metallo-hydrolase [Vicinamibacterales bacterium]|nr:MBL fold metallo-hydrolase [Vicinamibacterales bacterium]